MLSANTVAQNPRGKLSPALSPGQPCACALRSDCASAGEATANRSPMVDMVCAAIFLAAVFAVKSCPMWPSLITVLLADDRSGRLVGWNAKLRRDWSSAARERVREDKFTLHRHKLTFPELPVLRVACLN